MAAQDIWSIDLYDRNVDTISEKCLFGSTWVVLREGLGAGSVSVMANSADDVRGSPSSVVAVEDGLRNYAA